MPDLPLQPWMTAAPTAAVLRALDEAGIDARFVGGCVRDALAGRPVKDIDIAVDAPPDRVVDALAAAGLKSVPTGLDHGTVTAVADGHPFEITSLRRDVSTDGRRATVAFTRDWHEDAARRDLTMNALYLAPDGTLSDFFGGRADLAAGRVRFVGDPAARIAEDRLRLLRYFRFLAHYGRAAPDSKTLAACAAAAPQLSELSVERVAQELLRLLAAPDPAPVLRLMAEHGILAQALPEARDIDALAGLTRLEDARGAPDPLRRLGALCPGDPARAERLARRLKLSGAARERLSAQAGARRRLDRGADARARALALYDLGARAVLDAALTAQARAPEEDWSAWIAAAESWTRPVFPLGGADAAALGLPPGPAMGAALRRIERDWAENGFRDDRAALLGKLEALIRADGG